MSETTSKEGPLSLLLAKPLGRDLKKEQPHTEFFGWAPMYILRIPRTGKLTQGNSCPEWSVYSVDMNYPELHGTGSCLA